MPPHVPPRVKLELPSQQLFSTPRHSHFDANTYLPRIGLLGIIKNRFRAEVIDRASDTHKKMRSNLHRPPVAITYTACGNMTNMRVVIMSEITTMPRTGVDIMLRACSTNALAWVCGRATKPTGALRNKGRTTFQRILPGSGNSISRSMHARPCFRTAKHSSRLLPSDANLGMISDPCFGCVFGDDLQ